MDFYRTAGLGIDTQKDIAYSISNLGVAKTNLYPSQATVGGLEIMTEMRGAALSEIVGSEAARHRAEVEAAARLLLCAQHPVIVTGSGLPEVTETLKLLSKALRAPIISLPSDEKIAGQASYAAFRSWSDADVLLGIGTRFNLPLMRWTEIMRLVARPSPYLIRIEADAAELQRLVPHIGIVAEPEAGSAAILTEIRRLREEWQSTNEK